VANPETLEVCPLYKDVVAKFLNPAFIRDMEILKYKETVPSPELEIQTLFARNKSGGIENTHIYTGGPDKKEVWLMFAAAANHSVKSKEINVRMCGTTAYTRNSKFTMDFADLTPSSGQINSPEILAGKSYWIIPGYQIQATYIDNPDGNKVTWNALFWKFRFPSGVFPWRDLIKTYGT